MGFPDLTSSILSSILCMYIINLYKVRYSNFSTYLYIYFHLFDRATNDLVVIISTQFII